MTALKRLVARSIVDDKDVDIIGFGQSGRNAVHDFRDCCFGLIRHDEHQYSWLRSHARMSLRSGCSQNNVYFTTACNFVTIHLAQASLGDFKEKVRWHWGVRI